MTTLLVVMVTFMVIALVKTVDDYHLNINDNFYGDTHVTTVEEDQLIDSNDNVYCNILLLLLRMTTLLAVMIAFLSVAYWLECWCACLVAPVRFLA